MIIWSDPAVQSATIQAVASVLAATIAGICASVIGKQITNRQRLQEKLKIALSDISFLLAVEEAHCQSNNTTSSGAAKQKVRKLVRERNCNLEWSGKFTPGRSQDLMRRLG